MERKKKDRYVAFEGLVPGRVIWSVLDTKTNKLVEIAGEHLKYPEAWARNKAYKLNKDSANETI